jgi:hypothetical protein
MTTPSTRFAVHFELEDLDTDAPRNITFDMRRTDPQDGAIEGLQFHVSRLQIDYARVPSVIVQDFLNKISEPEDQPQIKQAFYHLGQMLVKLFKPA